MLQHQWLFGSIRGTLANVTEKRAAGAPLKAFGDAGTDDTDGFHIGLATAAVQAAKGVSRDDDIAAAVHAGVNKAETAAYATAGLRILGTVVKTGATVREAVDAELARSGGRCVMLLCVFLHVYHSVCVRGWEGERVGVYVCGVCGVC